MLFCFSPFLISCQKRGETDNKPGIAISFDDHFIKEWYALRPLFQRYNAKVTFYITCPDTLNALEMEQLKQLEKDGHEIAFHSTNHSKSTELIAAGGPKGYYESEIAPGMKYMSLAGFKPTSYAHPGGNHNAQVDSVLFANGFKTIRDVAISKRKLFGFQIYALAPRLMPWIFYDFKKQKSVDALLIDTDSGLNANDMKDAIQKAKDTHTALMLFGHQPLYKAPQGSEYGFSVQFLETILEEAKKQNLHFYKMSELAEH